MQILSVALPTPSIGTIMSVIHGENASQELFEKVIVQFNDFHATPTLFDPCKVILVDVSMQLHPEMKKRCGYKKNEKLPAYVFRLEASASYLATEKITMAIDLVMPIIKGNVTEGTPSLLIIEWPDKQYRLDGNRRYLLQRCLIMKSIRENAQLNIVRYLPFTDQYNWPEKEPADFSCYYHKKIGVLICGTSCSVKKHGFHCTVVDSDGNKKAL